MLFDSTAQIQENKIKHVKFKKILDVLTIVLFGLAFLSIPLCSFNSSLYLLTWILTGLFVASGFANLLFYYGFKFDFNVLMFGLFGISAFMSSLFSGFVGFHFTPIILAILAAFIYMYGKSTKFVKPLLFAIYIACAVFLFIFVIKYRVELFTFNFSRLGQYFGDQNEIALFFAVGFMFSIYCFFNYKKILYKILLIISAGAFLLCGFSCGSKMFLLASLICAFAIVFFYFGKRKLHISLLLTVGIMGLFIGIIFLPQFKEFRVRIQQFFSYLFYGKTSSYDYGSYFREIMFKDGIEMFLRKPFFGWGTWGFATFGGLNKGWSHNNLSESLCNFGIIGSILFHFVIGYSIYKFIKCPNKKNNILPFITILFFVLITISSALNGLKIYAYMIGIVCVPFSYDVKDIFSTKGILLNENSRSN